MHHGLISASQNLLQLCAYQMMLKHIIVNLIISHGSIIKRLNNLANFFVLIVTSRYRRAGHLVYIFSQARRLVRNVCQFSRILVYSLSAGLKVDPVIQMGDSRTNHHVGTTHDPQGCILFSHNKTAAAEQLRVFEG